MLTISYSIRIIINLLNNKLMLNIIYLCVIKYTGKANNKFYYFSIISIQWCHTEVQKKSDELLCTTWSLVMVRNHQLPAQVVKDWLEITLRLVDEEETAITIDILTIFMSFIEGLDILSSHSHIACLKKRNLFSKANYVCVYRVHFNCKLQSGLHFLDETRYLLPF